MEDAWLKSERESFIVTNFALLGIDQKKLNKAIEVYNKQLEKALCEESPYVAEDLQLQFYRSKVATIEAKYKGEDIKEDDTGKQEDREPRQADREGTTPSEKVSRRKKC